MDPRILQAIKLHPGMWLLTSTFDAALAFLDGYDTATEGGLQRGLREWLIVRADDGNNLSHGALIDREARKKLGENANERERVVFLIDLFQEFLRERDREGGYRLIYVRYEQWLMRQSWYDETSPQWLGRVQTEIAAADPSVKPAQESCAPIEDKRTDWEHTNLQGFEVIYRVARAYEVRVPGKIPGDRFKIHVFDQIGNFTASGNVTLGGRVICGSGATEVEALQACLKRFEEVLNENCTWTDPSVF